MLERAVAKALVEAAKAQDLFIRKCRWEGRVGAPDYIVLRDGTAHFIETKAPGERPRASQIAEFRAIQTAGATVWIVDSIPAATAAIRAIAGV